MGGTALAASVSGALTAGILVPEQDLEEALGRLTNPADLALRESLANCAATFHALAVVVEEIDHDAVAAGQGSD